MLQRDINFSISAGDILSIQGPNGVGKTTLLRAIAGLLEVPDGAIVFRLHPNQLVTSRDERMGMIGWLGHQDGMKRELSLAENLQFYRRFNRASGDVQGALASVGLEHLQDVPAQYLSHGQRRRLAFARLLLCAHSLWLVDEPMSGIDSTGKECIRRHLRQHCAMGGIAIAAVHEPLGLQSASLELE